MAAPVAIAAGKVAAKGGKRAAKAVVQNPGSSLLIALAGLWAASNLASRAARQVSELPGEILDAVIPDALQREGTRLGDQLRSFEFIPTPIEELQTDFNRTVDFFGGVFNPPAEDEFAFEGNIEPVIVPRPIPTNEAAELGETVGDFLFDLPFTDYDVRDIPGSIIGWF